MFPRTYSYPKVLVYAVGACGIVAVACRPSSNRALLALAALIAMAFLFRHDHGVYLGIASVTAVGLASRPDGWRVALGRGARLAAFVLVMLAPWALFVRVNGGLVPYF